MLYAGLDLSRKRLDFCLLDELGERVEVGAAPPDADGLHSLTVRVGRFGGPVFAAIESMNGARFVHDQLELAGWERRDRRRAEGEGAGTAGVQDRPDRRLGARRAGASRSGAGDLAARPDVRAERERARFRLHLVRHRTASRTASTPCCSPSATPARSPTCSASAAASCSRGSTFPSRGQAPSPRACS